MEENFEIKNEKEKEVDISDTSETVKIDKKAEEIALEKEPTVKKKEIKKKCSKEKSRKTTVKKSEEPMVAVEVTDENFDVQLQQQDIIAEEMVTSEKIKIEAEKEKLRMIDSRESQKLRKRSKMRKKGRRPLRRSVLTYPSKALQASRMLTQF
ncbi:hypothetical protein WUBG_18217 [Wuchereria bancrofti]|uniref:Uncharacterized protein n=1 Tax=Wuchereria bancrofti TaxID=6293 RepID=J9E1R3_WUCBA|nr:hypothetical protein WUBG_18217 [Wuchereria bancrofti]